MRYLQLKRRLLDTILTAFGQINDVNDEYPRTHVAESWRTYTFALRYQMSKVRY